MRPVLAVIALAMVATATAGIDTIGDPQTYSEHRWAWYVFGMDFFVLALVMARWWAQSKINDRVLDHMAKEEEALEDIKQRLAQLEGIAKERGETIARVKGTHKNILDATFLLRDCLEQLEARINKVEDKLQMARDRAIVRLSLRGMVFQELSDPPLEDEEG